MSVSERLRQVVGSLRPLWDVLEGRVVEPQPPAWCEARGWSTFLLGLSDEDLDAAERLGLATVLDRPDALADLRALAESVRATVEPLHGVPVPVGASQPESTGVSARKRSQVASLLRLVRSRWSDVGRVVDFGAGHGHLTRALARGLEVPAVGIDRDAGRIRTATDLADDDDGPAFLVADGERALELAPGDLVVGLHACGSLGDALVRRAIEGRAHGLLVSCCLQKIDGDQRLPLSRAGRDLGLALPKAILGLTNLTYGDDPGGFAVRGRRTRHALRLLLAGRGAPVSAGEEARGINRRRFRAGLAEVAADGCARRGLPPPADDEIELYETRAAREHASIRRLSLPRSMLGRVVEYAIVLDRASAFEDQGYEVAVQPLFTTDSSPRNLGIVAVSENVNK